MTLDAWLTGLDRVELEAVLERRPEVLVGSAPRDLRALAQRLEHPQSVFALLSRLPLPHLQILEALAALGDRATEADLVALLDPAGSQHVRQVTGILAELRLHAVVWSTADGHLHLAAGAVTLLPDPLGLSLSLRALLPALNVDALRRVLHRIGVIAPARRADLEVALLGELSDPGHVLALLASAPAGVIEPLLALAQPDQYETDYDGGTRRHSYAEREQQQTAYRWASERGLLMPSPYGYGLVVPAEVGLALRGPTYRAPFTPIRPEPEMQPVDPASVRSACSAAATDFSQQAAAVLDVVASGTFPMAKSGGLGVRELARLAKLAMVDPTSARLTLELADALALLVTDDQALGVTGEFRQWREGQPAHRYTSLARAWWDLPFSATVDRDADAKTTRPLGRRTGSTAGETARHAVVRVLTGIAEGQATQIGSLLATVAWECPMANVTVADGEAELLAAWSEASLLGVVALGTLTDLGRALDHADPDHLVRLATAALPANSDRAVFGSDLTVLVAGSPTAAVSSLLDSAADRESRGAGITWRFSRISVRRALDDGADAAQLATQLATIAGGKLPQPLSYLIDDVARRHGELRLSTAETLIRSEDTARLAEAAVDRNLRKLSLRLLAPTILSSQASLPETMTALRKAGYFPMPEADLAADPEPASSPLTLPEELRPPRPTAQLSATSLAAALAGKNAAEHRSPTELALAEASRLLSQDEVHQLAHAIDSGSAVTISYESASGARTRRTISQGTLLAGSLYAYCHLRNDERFFTVSRVFQVTPARQPR